MTLGLAKLEFEDIPGILDPGNLTTASLNFSADADILVTTRLSLRPSAEVGYGRVLGESDYAWTYCPSSSKWDRCSAMLSECFAHQFHITRRVVDSANDVSRWSFS